MRSSLLAPRGLRIGTKASPRPARADGSTEPPRQTRAGSQPHTVQLRLEPNLCISTVKQAQEPLIAAPESIQGVFAPGKGQA